MVAFLMFNVLRSFYLSSVVTMMFLHLSPEHLILTEITSVEILAHALTFAHLTSLELAPAEIFLSTGKHLALKTCAALPITSTPFNLSALTISLVRFLTSHIAGTQVQSHYCAEHQ